MTDHTIQLKDTRPNAKPDPDEVELLARSISSWFVRMDGKYYDSSDPRNKFSRDDVTAACIWRFREEIPQVVLTSDLLSEAFEVALTRTNFDPTLSVPTWNGSVRCLPGHEERLIWKTGMVTVNSWTKPDYRRIDVDEADPGTVQDFLDFIFPSERERDVFLDWLAWCLQNEAEKPTWGPILYSKRKGTGKSTLCEIARLLFGQSNSQTQNNVDKLTGQFNMQMMTSKFLVSEELDNRAGTKAANALKTFMTETDTAAEAKGRELERVVQCFCCMFTTNHFPLWIEENDRRYWITEIDHEGCHGGPRHGVFTQLVGNVKAYLRNDLHLARLYRWLMERELPAGFTGMALDAVKYRTPTMDLIFGNNGQTTHDMMQEYLDEKQMNAIAESDVARVVVAELKANLNSTKHLMSELGWRKKKVKWGGKDFARAVWVRGGYDVIGGKLIHPDGSAEVLFEVSTKIEATIHGFDEKAAIAHQLRIESAVDPDLLTDDDDGMPY